MSESVQNAVFERRIPVLFEGFGEDVMLPGTVYSSYASPPVVETIIGVQFANLTAFRSHHYGWFWKEFLESNVWTPLADEKLLPEYTEKFDDLVLKTSSVSPPNALSVRFKLRHKDGVKTIQIQPDKFYLSWLRSENQNTSYTTIRPIFDDLFNKFHEFALSAALGELEPNLWEVMYVNRVPRGELWQEPKDWHKVLPKLFAQDNPSTNGMRFATFDGTWHYEIEPKKGRIHFRVAKMVLNQSPDPVLFMQSTARGQIVEGDRWSDGLDIGHDACVRFFDDITSADAQKYWGKKS